MPIIYLLNLKFDPNRTDGIFEDNPGGNPPPLQTSKMWVTAQGTWDGSFNPANLTWSVAGTDPRTTLRVQDSPFVGVRLWPSSPTGVNIRLSVIFGRKNRGSRLSSPFLTSGNNARCVFDSVSTDFAPPGPDGSYCWPLGTVARKSNQPGNDTYEFVVGASLWSGITFGHDPEMDVAS
ncbi:MAG: hypothetical protein K2Q23_13265, partial [Bryobacteraceae bacterium]|nr:hypothetical protein [Bryobacteraceae bacterium]